MEKLKVIESNKFGDLEILTIKGKIWFPSIDAAKKLGYSNPYDAIIRHTKKRGLVNHEVIDSLGRKQNKKFIDEGNLYRLIVSSRMPQAEKFEEWVFDEVLPDVRRYGMYINDEFARAIIDNPEEAREEMLKYFNESQRLQDIVNEQQEEIDRLKQAERDLIDVEKKLEFLQERPENNDWKKEANKRVRKLAPKVTGFARQNFGTAWNEIYREMYYSENINIKVRHKRRIQRMVDDNVEQNKIDNTTILDTIGTDIEYVDKLFRVIDKLEEKYEYKKETSFSSEGYAEKRSKEFRDMLGLP